MESTMRHLSPVVLTSAQVAPKVQIWVMILAVYQTISTFLVAHKVFAYVYRQRGLAASVGAHCSWTINKVTFPVRILRKLYEWMERRHEWATSMNFNASLFSQDRSIQLKNYNADKENTHGYSTDQTASKSSSFWSFGRN
jgi:hypothetical protein